MPEKPFQVIQGDKDMPFSDRQKKASALSQELSGLPGVWVLNAMPLPESQEFSVQVLAPGRNRLMQILRDLGYAPQLRSVMPRITPNGMEASETWAVELSDRMPIVDDRAPPVTVDVETNREREKAAKAELEAFRKAWQEGKI